MRAVGIVTPQKYLVTPPAPREADEYVAAIKAGRA